MRRICSAGIVVVCMLAWTGIATAQGGSKPLRLDKDKVITAVDALERDPLGSDAQAVRGALLQWLEGTDQVTMNIVAGVINPYLESKAEFSKELMAHHVLAGASFILQHPDSASNQLAVDRAGTLGAIRAYEAILKARPKATMPELDRIIALRAEGKLDDYLIAAIKATVADDEK